jgi:hypothetical protein
LNFVEALNLLGLRLVRSSLSGNRESNFVVAGDSGSKCEESIINLIVFLMTRVAGLYKSAALSTLVSKIV